MKGQKGQKRDVLFDGSVGSALVCAFMVYASREPWLSKVKLHSFQSRGRNRSVMGAL